METKNIIYELRNKAGLSQDELAEKVYVTRQAVSRWKNGETTPNTETLKLLSKLFDVSINTLLGSPRQLICQCCGMPLEDSKISKEADGFFNEEYCKWCYADGKYMYHNMDDLIDVCAKHMANEEFSLEQARAYMRDMLPKLNYWKRYKNLDGAEKFDEFKKQLMDEINALHIEGMPKVEKLNALVGGYINLEYRLPNGKSVKFLDDGATYLGNQLESEFGGSRCFGIAANMEFILVSTYEKDGENFQYCRTRDFIWGFQQLGIRTDILDIEMYGSGVSCSHIYIDFCPLVDTGGRQVFGIRTDILDIEMYDIGLEREHIIAYSAAFATTLCFLD